MSQEHEVWKPIPGFPHYEASSMGRVRLKGVITMQMNLPQHYDVKHGWGMVCPNTRNDGDRYDCYMIMSDAHTAIAMQLNGIRYAYPAIHDREFMAEYVSENIAYFK